MADNAEVLQEEYEVLESIFPDELEKVSDDTIRIRVEPDDPITSQPLITSLQVIYPPTYPDAVPDLTIEATEGELTQEETTELLDEMKALGEESLGMAMVFTLTSWLKEALSKVIHERVRVAKEIEDKKSAAAEEAEAARKRGTPVTTESFAELTKRLRLAADAKRVRLEEERIRALPPKEREEYKKIAARPTGKQLFETMKNLADSDIAYTEEGVAEVDLSQYSREERDMARQEAEEAEEEGVKFYDSD